MLYLGSSKLRRARNPWKSRRTTPGQSGSGAFFRIVHPFHPLSGQELERASGPPQASQRFVWFHTAEGRLSQVPLNFTDLVEPDPYVAVSSGRAYLGLKDLLGLVDLLRELGQEGQKNV
jgi:Family of unknown function (DUF5372)